MMQIQEIVNNRVILYLENRLSFANLKLLKINGDFDVEKNVV